MESDMDRAMSGSVEIEWNVKADDENGVFNLVKGDADASNIPNAPEGWSPPGAPDGYPYRVDTKRQVWQACL